jgi:hypothetical protein
LWYCGSGLVGDIEQEIEEEKKRQQELDAQIREMEKKVREQQTGGGRGESGGNDRKATSAGGGGGSSSAGKKSAGMKQKSTRKLEDQLQLVRFLWQLGCSFLLPRIALVR